MKIRKAVIPAAGLGTRFMPITKTLAKEMFPILDKPCLEYIVEEAVKSGIQEIVFIINKRKQAIKDYFGTSFKVGLKHVKISYVNQPHPGGDGHAILYAYKYVKNEPFAVMFGDDIYDSKTPALAQLIKEYERHHSPIIALQKIDRSRSKSYGIIDFKSKKGRSYEIKSLVEKPAPARAPSDMAIVGRYIVTPQLLKTLKKSRAGGDGELRLIDGMKNFIKTSSIYGHEISGRRFDTGNKLGYMETLIYFALKSQKLSPSIKNFIKGLDLK